MFPGFTERFQDDIVVRTKAVFQCLCKQMFHRWLHILRAHIQGLCTIVLRPCLVLPVSSAGNGCVYFERMCRVCHGSSDDEIFWCNSCFDSKHWALLGA